VLPADGRPVPEGGRVPAVHAEHGADGVTEVGVLTALPCQCPTVVEAWPRVTWGRPAPVLVVEVGAPGQLPAWRVFLGLS
jgi:hypothetical protein